MKKISLLFIALAVVTGTLKAQVDLSYQLPPKEILELADAPVAPVVQIDKKAENIVLLHRNRFSSIAELSETELRLAGLRINPLTNIGSRTYYYNNITLMKVGEREEKQVAGLPAEPRLAYFSWSPDESKMAFTQTSQTGVELWILDIENASCRKITDAKLNANIGRPYSWFTDGESLLVQFLPDEKKPLIVKAEAVPVGPTVSVSDGKKAQNPTYQDLLKDKADEFNFEQLAMATLYKVDLNGVKSPWKETAMYRQVNFSPNGEYVLVSTIEKPFSYLVTLYRFPSKTIIYDKNGKEIKVLLESPLVEDLPKGSNATVKGMRSINWRNDKPATIYYVEALDEGDPEKEAEYRDEVFMLNEPFTGKPVSIVKTIHRYAGITWGNNDVAVARDRWIKTRNTKTYLFNPSKPDIQPEIIFDLNYNDNYNDPGSFVTAKNEFGENSLVINGGKMYLTGAGYSPEGIRPFFDEYNLKTKTTKHLWRADGKENLENISEVINAQQGVLLTRVESQAKYPNYFIRNTIKRIAPQQITFFKNPFERISGIHKEVITYKRADGVELSGTLYLPAGYDMQKKEKLPLIMWAYPREFKDASNAGQVTSSPHTFTLPSYGSPVFWVTRGYAILDNAAFPIVGEGDKEPNDTFIEQLVANAKAAIDAVDQLGYIDRTRVAVGGHSYGAFMTANLLTHCNLFAAGIARSGAYNRTLTPFGFQNEERSYWEAPEVYNTMSPFMNADKMKTPLLLIHGEADNNTGTFPLQSERYFNALKGMGAPTRLVLLPKESHGYSARESVLHVLWEQDQWLEKFVKNKELINGN
ncbi:prolyl oligopeptidase family serine peptidase [Draconibacterium sp.]|jgi:dipeptidyl aminopeptidase/acylaminoacyl peptidase